MKKPDKNTPAQAKKSSRSYYALEDLDITGEVALQYGFMPIIGPKITPEDTARMTDLSKEAHASETGTEERLAVLRIFHDETIRLPQPAMLYFKRPLSGSDIRRKAGFEMCGIEILGVARPSADALVFQTVWAQLTECGADNMYFEINSVGDKESFGRFEREFTAYIKKNMNAFSPDNREEIKADPYSLFHIEGNESEIEIRNNAPRPMNFLSEISRIHFKEVLEFLESAGLPYQICDTLLPVSRFASHTVFQVKGTLGKNAPEIILANGARYNALARKAGYKKEVPYCSATIWYPKKVAEKTKHVSKFKPSRFYLVQLGTMAKLRTLSVIELLRQEKIPVYHSITRENLSSQLASAEYLRVSHLLIIGQKEAIDQSVVVRSTDIREQETVKINMLAEYLKNILKKLS